MPDLRVKVMLGPAIRIEPDRLGVDCLFDGLLVHQDFGVLPPGFGI